MGGMKLQWHLSVSNEVVENLESVQIKDLRITLEITKCQWDNMNSIYEIIKPTSN